MDNGKVKTENIVLEYTANTGEVVEQVDKVTDALKRLQTELKNLNKLSIKFNIEMIEKE